MLRPQRLKPHCLGPFAARLKPCPDAAALALTLAMFRIAANHAHHAAAVDHFALHANFLDRCPDFHSVSVVLSPIPKSQKQIPCLRQAGSSQPLLGMTTTKTGEKTCRYL